MSFTTLILLLAAMILPAFAVGLLVDFAEMKRSKRFRFREHMGPVWGTKKAEKNTK